MTHQQDPQVIINNIISPSYNKTADYYINIIHSPFVTFTDTFVIPLIPVKELTPDIAADILIKLRNFIPEYMTEKKYLYPQRPASEQHFIQLINCLKGRVIDFIHMFKIDCKFSGDPSTIINKGGPDFYPSFRTNRIYYDSLLIPVRKKSDPESPDNNFSVLKITKGEWTESDQYFHTFAMFDDENKQDKTSELNSLISTKIFPFPESLFPFLRYDYLTACFSVIDPTLSEIKKSATIYEPLFIKIFSSYKDLSLLAGQSELKKTFPELDFDSNNSCILTREYIEQLQNFHSQYTLTRTKEMTLKGWWRFNFHKQNNDMELSGG